MRLIAIIFLLLFIAAGIVFGALNADLVPFDFGFARGSVPKGAAMLVALLVGWILGGITAWLGTSWANQRKRRRALGDRKAGSAKTA
ncbi:MAG: Lipopolysaccharide assembly protein A [Luteibacter sp.]|uniref:LapA family protein n=1 Tax=Luteibacter sp. TaxID=1886636 RepID=UPI0013850DCA|nr:LapA family protein [Luteibacter sp.]KAF1006471.1 MAG: Lipopolysaccharide assembly protein A [Luteibacter sp.]